MKTSLFTLLFVCAIHCLSAQNVNDLLKKTREKLATVKDYQAEGVMKTQVPFLNAPDSKVTIYYKQPDKFKIKKQQGISIVPKGGISVNLSSMLASDKFTAIDAGNSTLNGVALRVVKLIPLDEKADIVLSTLYIDAGNYLIRKVSSTTRTNGSFEMELNYGKYASWGLPDKVVFSFEIKDYKLPKGVTFEYDDDKPKQAAAAKDQKGKVEITYSSYEINKGVPDAVFTAK